jgi:hypothetical protein
MQALEREQIRHGRIMAQTQVSITIRAHLWIVVLALTKFVFTPALVFINLHSGSRYRAGCYFPGRGGCSVALLSAKAYGDIRQSEASEKGTKYGRYILQALLHKKKRF